MTQSRLSGRRWPALLLARRSRALSFVVGGLLCTVLVAACSDTGPASVVTLTAVSPAEGPLAGGTVVTLTGTNFPTTVDSVRVGTGRLGSLMWLSGTQLTGITPPGSTAGDVDVVVHTTSAGQATCTGCFTYNPAITVTGVSPSGGSLTGGTAVTLTGTSFPIVVDSVRVGAGRLGIVARVSATELWGTAPPASAAGAVDVVVYTTSAGDAACPGCFTYNPWGTSLKAGRGHACGLTSGGAAYCWGYNHEGQVGDSSTTTRLAPVAVAGGLVFTSLTAGGYHTCGLTSSGTAYCWGRNDSGELGDYSTTNRSSPVAVAGGIAFASLAAGRLHTCGLTSNGAAYCWGQGVSGQLGDGLALDESWPVAVAGGLAFASLIAGNLYTCGLTAGGVAYCWGYNQYGQLGDGSTANRWAPVAVAGGLVFASLTAAGHDHTCGLTIGGAAYCWGHNQYGQLGNDSTTDHLTPAPVAGGLAFTSLIAGMAHTCGVTRGGVAYCWGNNYRGALGDGSTTDRWAPGPVVGGLAFASLTAGYYQTCGLTTGAAAYCWGYNDFGQLGDGSTTDRLTPVAVANP
jgi:alpha-tubulin suppressor-like RCC1 family protein